MTRQDIEEFEDEVNEAFRYEDEYVTWIDEYGFFCEATAEDARILMNRRVPMEKPPD